MSFRDLFLSLGLENVHILGILHLEGLYHAAYLFAEYENSNSPIFSDYFKPKEYFTTLMETFMRCKWIRPASGGRNSKKHYISFVNDY